ncbi:DUF6544 family protein [Paracoccus sp. (in: a-proteobacteria)]|uniref:DUF6544 family protein n=1 Tax=Paracoccus sp. TaxID=267 RepID=UPI0032208640
MKSVILISSICILVAIAALWVWRLSDIRAERRAGAALAAIQPARLDNFDAAMVAGLPEPAQRYFRFSIRRGTPLFTVARITMTGQFSLGIREAPDYMAMTAQQVLASPEGFVWSMSARRGVMRISGSDGAVGDESWTRFWLMGLIPVARAGGTGDHWRSAFGRHVGEAVFWTPAALLPRPGVVWKAVDDTTARVTVTHNGIAQSVDVTVDAEGRPVTVVIPRWSDANPDKTWRLQPFGGHLSEFRDFGGFQLPTHVEADNQFGTDAYFPFFIADVTDITFIPSSVVRP